MRTLLAIILALCCLLPVSAQEAIRPVSAAYTFELGASHLADTYLSPIRYEGWHAGLGYERMQAMRFDPERFVMQLTFGVGVDRTLNQVRNSVMWRGDIDFSWAMMRRWNLSEHVTLGTGGVAMLNLGCLYLSRNGNNPASAKASVNLGVTGYAAWKVNFRSLPVTVRYQASMPLIGEFFAPGYGELYYEIYLGDTKGLAHVAWPGNYMSVRNLLTVDLHFGATSLRLGYSGDILSTCVNHVTTRISTHCAVIGISGEWITLNPRRQPNKFIKGL